MTAKEMRKILKVVADDTEIVVGKFKVKSVVRHLEGGKMTLVLVPDTVLVAAP